MIPKELKTEGSPERCNGIEDKRMKSKARMRVYRLLDGEVAASIVDDKGDLLDVMYFGKFTENQYASLRKVIDKHASMYGVGQTHSDLPEEAHNLGR